MPPEPLPGTVHAEYSRCGKRSCHCAQGRRHGPFYRRFWREGGRTRSTYVPLAEVPDVVAACARHAELHPSRRAVQRMVRTLERASDVVIAALDARLTEED